MKATIEIDLKPFQVPNFVIAIPKTNNRTELENNEKTYSLSALDSGTLDKLCREFRNEVFKKAGKQEPPTCANATQ